MWTIVNYVYMKMLIIKFFSDKMNMNLDIVFLYVN